MNAELLNRIELDPKIMLGKPVIRGTRIPVELLVGMAAQGISVAEILREYPRLQLVNLPVKPWQISFVAKVTMLSLSLKRCPKRTTATSCDEPWPNAASS